MSKFLRVTFSDGMVYDIPAEFIARARAEYYAESDAKKGENYTEIYNEELKIGLEDEYEIIDWAFNNMDWIDVQAHAVMVAQESKFVDYKEEWANVKNEVITKNE